ncbi:protein FAR1-RELATED SEQUENCE 5-like [Carex rostrata]
MKTAYQESTQVQKFEEPKIGMEFPTEDAAYKFYNVYAYYVGFSIRKNLIRKNTSGVLTMRTFTCCKEGYYRERLNQKKPKKEHLDVPTPSKRKLLRSQKEMSEAEKANAHIADSARLKPKQTYDLLAKQASGRKHLCFSPIDYKNYLRSKRMHDMALGDAGALMQYLQKRVKEDPAFYYVVQLDEDDQITNILWTDGRSLIVRL